MIASESLVFVELSPFLITTFVGTVLPLLVGLVTRLTTKAVWKGLLLILFNAITALITGATMVGSRYVFSKENVFTALFGFVSAVATYTGLWKAAGLTSSAVVLPGANPGSVEHVPGKLANVGLK